MINKWLTQSKFLGSFHVKVLRENTCFSSFFNSTGHTIIEN